MLRSPLVFAGLLVFTLPAHGQAVVAGANGIATRSLPHEQRALEIYRELIEIDTTHDSGSTTEAANAMAARLIALEYDTVLAAAAFHSSGAETARLIAEVRESGSGGMAHACELETSMYLAIDPDAVEMDKAVDEHGYPQGKHATMDWSDGPLKIMPWWSAFSRTGIQGDARKATAEKGKTLLEAAVAECVEFVHELLEKPLPQRQAPQETLS